MSVRVVLDTSTVVSALLFERGRLAWLRRHWMQGGCTPLISRATAEELTRVLAYLRFRLGVDERDELLSDYLVYCETVRRVRRCRASCRDPADRPFLDLAYTGRAAVLVTGDDDLLEVSGRAGFAIETPAGYKQRILEGGLIPNCRSGGMA